MSKKRETFWDKQASRRMIFVCFLLIIAAFICFGGTYLQFKSTNKNSDEIWNDQNASYDQKVEAQKDAEKAIREDREKALEQ